MRALGVAPTRTLAAEGGAPGAAGGQVRAIYDECVVAVQRAVASLKVRRVRYSLKARYIAHRRSFAGIA